jgi:hypothetical protein
MKSFPTKGIVGNILDGFTFGLILGLLVGCAFAFAAGYQVGVAEMQRDAVYRGYAHYEQASGRWRWGP